MSTRVDGAAHPVRSDDQVFSRRHSPIGCLGVVTNHSGEVVALEDRRTGVVEDHITHRIVRVAIVFRGQSTVP